MEQKIPCKKRKKLRLTVLEGMWQIGSDLGQYAAGRRRLRTPFPPGERRARSMQRNSWRWLRLSILFLAATPIVTHASPPENSSVFKVPLRFSGSGHLEIADNAVAFPNANRFAGDAQARLTALVETVLSTLQGGSTEPDGLAADLREFAMTGGPWMAAVINYAKSGGDPLDLMSRLIGALDNRLGASTPLSIDSADQNTVDALLQRGELDFAVAEPIHVEAIDLRLPGRPPRSATKAEKMRILGGLEGGLWFRDDLENAILDHLRDSPLFQDPDPRFHPSIQISGGDRRISVLARQIARVWVSLDETASASDVKRIMYLLLSHDQFLRYLSIGTATGAAPNTRSGVLGSVIIDFSRDLGAAPGTEPYLLSQLFQAAQARVAELGYGLGFPSTPVSVREGPNYVDLFVSKPLPDSNKPSGTAPASAGEGTGEASPPPTSGEGAGAEPPAVASREDGDGGPSEVKAKVKRNYLGGGIDFRPEQGIRFFGKYKRQFSNGGSAQVELGGHGEALARGDYFQDFLFFDRLHRRFSIKVTGKSDFEAKRLLLGREVDERRSGGEARAEIEWFRDWKGQSLGNYLVGRRETVELEDENSIVSTHNLSTLDVGLVYGYQNTASLGGTLLELSPSMRFRLDSAGESRFGIFRLTGDYRQRLPRRLSLEIRGRVELASSGTPIFEQPSLSSEVVRGVRRDDGVGRRLWGLQPELGLPLPKISGENQFVRLLRQIRLACFFDVGAIEDVSSSVPGVRWAPGVGLHLQIQGSVLRLDWAYVEGPEGSDTGRGRLVFSFGLPL